MLHYIYKIHFLCGFPSGRYYIGKRNYNGVDLSKDKYAGSGIFCKDYYKKYGKKEGVIYIKEIVEINPSAKINRLREKELIGTKYKDDDLCMNAIAGGSGGDECEGKPVIQYDLEGNEVARYKNESEAASSIGLKHSSGISFCCIQKDLSNMAGGYLWRFENDPITKNDKFKILTRVKQIYQYDLSGKLIKIFKNAIEAEKETGVISGSIIECCKRRRRYKAGRFIWRYKNDTVTKTDLKNAKFYDVIKINQYDSEGVLIKQFNSLKEAADSVNGKWQCIQNSCNNHTFSYGYIWLRDNDDIKNVNLNKKRSSSRVIYQYDLNGNLLKKFKTLKDAGKSIGVAAQSIQACCNGKSKQSGGYIWKRDSWK